MKRIIIVVFISLTAPCFSQSALKIDSITYVQPTSQTNCDGQIQVHVSGGCTPYTYDFHDMTGSLPFQACCGVYPFTVTDNCSTKIYDTAYLCTAADIPIRFSQIYISIFPIPAKDILTIYGSVNFSNATIIIQNTLGQTAKQLPFSKYVPVSDLPEGCYFLQIIFESGETFKTKFIKQ